jgi:hypothetical protein
LALGVPGAVAANDAYSGRIPLGGTLPLSTAGSNLEASEEADEHPHEFDFEPAGHSVWYSWEAGDTEWVTVSTCGSGFDTLLGVYSGSSLSSLEKVVPGKEGPRADCGPGGQQVTFRAIAGTVYEIRVDGNLSPQPPAEVEGTFALQIATTPAPANDDFAAAQTVTAESLGNGTFFRVDVPGFSWNATKEIGEPAHGGDPGGASVWYSWTAPASGQAEVVVSSGAFSSQLGSRDRGLLGVYTGNALGGLTSVGTPGLSAQEAKVDVTAGTTYKLAVDGRFDAGTGLAAMGQITFLIYMSVPAPDVQIPTQYSPSFSYPAFERRTPPDTTIVERKIKPGKRQASFSFSSSVAASSFTCKLDSRRPARCGSPSTYVGLASGRHTLLIAAVDASGYVDPTPALARFSIPKPKPTHR